MGASTPHFALQIRNRIRNLIAGLPPDHPARRRGRARDRPARRARARRRAARRRSRSTSSRHSAESDATAPERSDLRPRASGRALHWAPERLPRPARPLGRAPRSTGPDPEPDADARRPAHLRALVAARPRPRRQGRARPGHGGRAPDRPPAARRSPPATACSTWPAAPATSRATSRVRRARPGLVVGLDVSETMLARAVEDTAGGLANRSPTCAATRRSCRSATRASTRSAASPRCTCSRTRCARSIA